MSKRSSRAGSSLPRFGEPAALIQLRDLGSLIAVRYFSPDLNAQLSLFPRER
jgi:hypothetical protein